MIFTEPRFLWFFLLCFGVHWLLRGMRSRKLWLLACSYIFYGVWDYRFLALILASTVIDYGVGLALARTERRRRFWLTVSMCANLGILGFFKYFGFFTQAGSDMLAWLGLPVDAPTLEIVLPVGISFFTFQTMSYTIDIYRRELAPTRDFFDFSLFVAFFPQLVAGPIVRAREFLPQLMTPKGLAAVRGRRMLLLFLSGFFKKACLADNIAGIIDPVFAAPGDFGSAGLVLASVLYSVQIYCDFSGYSDMAIAVAGMLGYELPKNFDFPYFARNVQELWRRWHISLSGWLRDYLYVSLGGGRGGGLATLRNLVVTMLLGGLWHGANWTFVLWGGLHGLALVVHRLWRLSLASLGGNQGPRAGDQRGGEGRLHALVAVLLTFIWTTACFTLFRCPSIGVAIDYGHALLSGGGNGSLNPDLWLLCIALGAGHFALFRHGPKWLPRVEAWPEPAFYVAYGIASALLPFLSPLDAEPFIYFQF